MNIVLTVFMATGKTEISKAIAAMSDYTLIDTDDMIVKAAGMTINEIFDKYGEKYFRELEHKCVCEAAKMDNMIIATGGGVVLDKANVLALRETGKIVNLAPEFSVIEERLSKAAATRPLLKNLDIEAVRKRFNDRLPFYADCDYSIRVTNDKQPQDFAREILEIFK